MAGTKITPSKPTSSQAAFPASLFPELERGMENQTTAISGRKCLELYRMSNRDGSLLRMFVESLVSRTAWYSSRCALIWRTKDTPFRRLLFQLSPSTRTTDGTEFGLWGTPNTMDHLPARSAKDCSTEQKNREGRQRSGNLREQVVHPRMWPTPNVDDSNHGEGGRRSGEFRSLTAEVKQARTENPVPGCLSPTWVEWLMGFPLGWTDLDVSGTPSCRKSPSKSSGQSKK